MNVSTSRTLALTGATGFVGSALLRRLRSSGWNIRALCRSLPPAGPPGEDRLEWIRGSLEDLDSLRALVRGTAAVVHCAGAIRGASAADFDRANVDGTARLVGAARAERPGVRFLLVSSLAARAPELSHYAGSKRRGEEAVAAGAGGMPWTALRPPAVYGPGDRETLPLVRCMRLGIAPVLGGPQARFSLVYVEDLADAVRHLLEVPCWRPGPYEIHDGQPGGYGWDELVATVGRIVGRRVHPVRIPAALLSAAGRASLAIALRFGGRPMLTPGKVRELTHPDWVCDDAALRAATGWRPATRLEPGMRRTLEHLRGGRWTVGTSGPHTR
jgi:nucleoside-diphosphate-sugar epimerase